MSFNPFNFEFPSILKKNASAEACAHQPGDIGLTLLVFNEEFLVHTSRRSYRLIDLVKCSDRGDVGGEPMEISSSKPTKKNDPQIYFKHLGETRSHRATHSHPRRARLYARQATNEPRREKRQRILKLLALSLRLVCGVCGGTCAAI
ncbi:hypothetical protein H5410_044054 [Solanum commersonii]|uniref:Uncharacterized protein n=1 Tax=Solanum commersonii TaxID=4109 RepID=A0A9J5Y2L6_SOLCO|nr:hypothetical protein H5410_044054 [Solanum commersonii]